METLQENKGRLAKLLEEKAVLEASLQKDEEELRVLKNTPKPARQKKEKVDPLAQVVVGRKIKHDGIIYNIIDIPRKENAHRYKLTAPGRKTHYPSKTEMSETLENGTSVLIQEPNSNPSTEGVTAPTKATEQTHTAEEQEALLNEVAELFKKNPIAQVVVHGKEIKTIVEGEEKKLLAFNLDLDAKAALYLINEFNNKTTEAAYTENAIVSVIPKGGSEKDLKGTKNQRDGLRIFVDVGGNWLKVEKGNETTTLHIDHHGSGKREATSATKMMYEIMERAGLLKEKPEWLQNFVKLVNDVDNLSYVEDKDANGKKIFNYNYFTEKWPYTMYALAEEIPFDTLLELFKSGKISDPSIPLTQEQLAGEIGKTTIKENKTIVEKSEELKIGAGYITHKLEDIRINSTAHLNLEQTKLGKIIYHNFTERGNGKTNKIENGAIAYLGTRALNCDTYMIWNEKYKSFFINSTHPQLSNIAEALNKKDPGSTVEVRGTFIFGKPKILKEEDFLNTIDPTILEGTILKGVETETFQISSVFNIINSVLSSSQKVKEVLGEKIEMEKPLTTEGVLYFKIEGENGVKLTIKLKNSNVGKLEIILDAREAKGGKAAEIKRALGNDINKIEELIKSKAEESGKKVEKMKVIGGKLKVIFETAPTANGTKDTTANLDSEPKEWTEEHERILAQLLETIEEQKRIIAEAEKILNELENTN